MIRVTISKSTGKIMRSVDGAKATEVAVASSDLKTVRAKVEELEAQRG